MAAQPIFHEKTQLGWSQELPLPPMEEATASHNRVPGETQAHSKTPRRWQQGRAATRSILPDHWGHHLKLRLGSKKDHDTRRGNLVWKRTSCPTPAVR